MKVLLSFVLRRIERYAFIPFVTTLMEAVMIKSYTPAPLAPAARMRSVPAGRGAGTRLAAAMRARLVREGEAWGSTLRRRVIDLALMSAEIAVGIGLIALVAIVACGLWG